MKTNTPSDKLINVVVIDNGNVWSQAHNAMVLVHAKYDQINDLPKITNDTYAIPLNELIYLGLRQMVMDKLIGKDPA